MKAPDRSNVASSFTLIKGAMIDETYAVFAAWDFGSTKKDNLERLRRENYIGVRTAARLRDFIFVLNRRFDPNDRDRALVRLAVEYRCEGVHGVIAQGSRLKKRFRDMRPLDQGDNPRKLHKFVAPRVRFSYYFQ